MDLGRTYRKILTPIDMRHADKSGKAIGVATELAKLFGAEYFMLTVWYPLGAHITDDPNAHKPDFEALVNAVRRKTNVSATPIFRAHESAAAAITKVSQEREIDLIVMASHDPRITDHIFNSNASEVALHTSCSVLVVR